MPGRPDLCTQRVPSASTERPNRLMNINLIRGIIACLSIRPAYGPD